MSLSVNSVKAALAVQCAAGVSNGEHGHGGAQRAVFA
jgi:hypothetical protein